MFFSGFRKTTPHPMAKIDNLMLEEMEKETISFPNLIVINKDPTKIQWEIYNKKEEAVEYSYFINNSCKLRNGSIVENTFISESKEISGKLNSFGSTNISLLMTNNLNEMYFCKVKIRVNEEETVRIFFVKNE